MRFSERFREFKSAPGSTPAPDAIIPVTPRVRYPQIVAETEPIGEELQKRLRAMQTCVERGESYRLSPDDANLFLKGTFDHALANAGSNFADQLPLLFRVNSNEFLNLEDYPPLRAFYDFTLSERFLLRMARQTGKSTSIAYKKTFQCGTIPNYKVLFVLPLFEQARRLSSNYVQQAINLSVIRNQVVDSLGAQNVLEKNFRNGSKMTFSYAYLNCDRTRGIPASEIVRDEAQDIDKNFTPIIEESLSGKGEWKIVTLAGTPKTLDNAMAVEWRRSSQGEWIIPCRACSKENIPSIDRDLLNMIANDTLRCANAKCCAPLDSHLGRWVQAHPSRIETFTGLHVSQPILPFHYRKPRAWRRLIKKRDTQRKAIFYNECLGEDCDAGSKLITVDALRAASKLAWHNSVKEAARHSRTGRYKIISLGIDWGGRGEESDSFTAMVVVGLLGNGISEVLYAVRMLPSENDHSEIDMAKYLYKEFRCVSLGHDFRGVGQAKHTMLRDAGLGHAMPWSNEPASVRFFAKVSRNQTGQVFVQVNRASAILLLAHEVNNGRFLFPKWIDEEEEVAPGEERDDVDRINPFLDLNSWYEDYVAAPDGRNLYRIMRSATLPDDVGMACIYGAFTNYRRLGAWPHYLNTLAPGGLVTDKSYTDPTRAARDPEAGAE